MYIPRPAKLLFQIDDGWDKLLTQYGDDIPEWTQLVVERMLACGTPAMGLRRYCCASPHCTHAKYICYRCLELCAALDKNVAVLRDNDGIDPVLLREPVENWLASGRRELFIGCVENGTTLEPQLVHHNSEASIRAILGITKTANLTTWMNREKTETALRIARASQSITPPDYMKDAARFIHG